ncbi:MAG: amidohydrolase family protein, partial [Candidatus Dormibacteraeota bacterium]|nr:amidohydrolase family protein [Candidatus Dormibacteraeota bacterium]
MAVDYWCELAWLGGAAAEPGVLLHVEGDRLAAVSRVAAPPASVERLFGLTLPGLVSAHSHAFQRALRGRTHGGAGSFWTWRAQMYELVEGLDPDRFLALTRAAFGEMALAGITLVGEFHYLHHGPGGAAYSDPNEMGRAVVAAAASAGVRLTLIDACYLEGGPGISPDSTQRRFSDGSAAGWRARVDALRDGPQAR